MCLAHHIQLCEYDKAGYGYAEVMPLLPQRHNLRYKGITCTVHPSSSKVYRQKNWTTKLRDGCNKWKLSSAVTGMRNRTYVCACSSEGHVRLINHRISIQSTL